MQDLILPMRRINLQNMVENIQEIMKEELPINIKQAMISVDRESFVPNGLENLAYSLTPLGLEGKQFISSPLTVAKMTKYLNANKTHKVLEIGLGSGYQASILAYIANMVFSIERIPDLLFKAREIIRATKIDNLITKLDDGQNGWSEFAPYDRILFSAAISHIPRAIINDLKIGGQIVAPYILPDKKQVITRFVKIDENTLSKGEVLEYCNFVKVLDGIGK